jgi:hypothetical protein
MAAQRTPLQNNSLSKLQRTLSDLADADRQSAYKASVPFVNVPEELLEQWSEHSRLLREQGWFRALFAPDQKDALAKFDADVNSLSESLGESTPDVPEILALPVWREIMAAAARLLPLLPIQTDEKALSSIPHVGRR